ncbi:Histidine kinase-, DNA gyrase B-, and HSP90-like ATPase [Xanthomonas sp. SS]|uniref:ATP-binding protein n=1 Tax=Xanthomonas sp. SS TaxID=2724122 RepID=UPI00163B2654|nr:ATP-binding protein [Xanthomonas sp. SS]QNH15035.1 Histidine kinase-, DNA gyrase B-, and HSP90-like ATPase [Xanthomonas sp. SS]
MAGVSHKQQLDVIDGTPEKRLFLSIISDYDLLTGICELIDNAIDLWIDNGCKTQLNIKVILNDSRQIIRVIDDAGGVQESQLRLLIAPGASRNKSSKNIIGTFGVGGKRAGVALGELVEIQTRHKKGKSLQLDITREWLANDDWSLAAYEIPDITPNTTSVTISQLRQQMSDTDISKLHNYLRATYGWFIQNGCSIELNEDQIHPITFDCWAFPPEFGPRRTTFNVHPVENKKLAVKIEAGLIHDRDPETENYGVYFYCNNRLIVKDLKTRDVGYFVSGEAGVPHPDASLCRVIVNIHGPAELMPWTSSKSGINYSHETFIQLRPTLINLVSYYSSLSRRLKKQWEEEVYAYRTGSVQDVQPEDVATKRRMVLPDLPRIRKMPRIQELKERNHRKINAQPWTIGLIEAMGMVDLISRQKIDTRNRIALILLDSNFEIAIKEFIVSRQDLFPVNKYKNSNIATLFEQGRKAVVKEVQSHISLEPTLIAKIDHYYSLRNSLIHERATQQITDTQINDYRKVVEKVLNLLFGLRFPS